MRAIVLAAPGPPSALVLNTMYPKPVAKSGFVLISVKAFGLNRSELHTRLGLAEGVTFPRVLGIEATGVVEECPGNEFSTGQKVFAMVGGMGRVFDGGYAEYVCVPVTSVIPFETSISDWSILGALPEMLQTAYGSLTVGCNLKNNHKILIRGGTSSVGMALAVLAKQVAKNVTVFSTTRSESRIPALKKIGVDHVILDDGFVAEKVRQIAPEGIDSAVELVGTPTLHDTLRSLKVHGVACFTGMLSNVWTVKDFYPIEYIPTGVKLTAYGGNADNLPKAVIQEFLSGIERGDLVVPIDKVYKMEEIVEAHERMENGGAIGKLVVIV